MGRPLHSHTTITIARQRRQQQQQQQLAAAALRQTDLILTVSGALLW
jgi:preprotein translocase subunit YajC